jgi:uncharacterized protein YkwD
MGRQGRTAALAAPFILFLLLAAYPAARAHASPRLDVIAEINAVRHQYGLRTLRLSPRLMRSAEAYSKTMMAEQYFGHAARIQASSTYRRLGEILHLHSGTQPDPDWAMHDWIHSPSHLGVILDPLFTYIGSGYTTGLFWGWSHPGRDTIWTVHFGRR